MRAVSLALSLIAAASSPTHTGWPPAEGVLSGSPCCPFLLKANERLFHTRRYVSRNEVGLLVFDRQFDLSNLSSTRLLVAEFPAFTFPGHVHEDPTIKPPFKTMKRRISDHLKYPHRMRARSDRAS